MPEKPINLKAWEVRALLEGRKTQKRMAPKPYPDGVWAEPIEGVSMLLPSDRKGLPWWSVGGVNGWKPRYAVGTVLWARETWAHCQPILSYMKPDGRSITEISDGYAEYKADGFDTIQDLKDHRQLVSEHEIIVNQDRWRPPMHMPRRFARLFLEVTDVRLERIQDISEEDAIAEGPTQHPNYPQEFFTTWKGAFQYLWNIDNPKHPWDTNPWVEVYAFKVLEGYNDKR